MPVRHWPVGSPGSTIHRYIRWPPDPEGTGVTCRTRPDHQGRDGAYEPSGEVCVSARRGRERTRFALAPLVRVWDTFWLRSDQRFGEHVVANAITWVLVLADLGLTNDGMGGIGFHGRRWPHAVLSGRAIVLTASGSGTWPNSSTTWLRACSLSSWCRLGASP